MKLPDMAHSASETTQASVPQRTAAEYDQPRLSRMSGSASE
jgi:hypothetical protein